ncbi:diaminopimelate epimerase [Campylobacter concisus]|uniref:Diaminopimelate epimerase n=1 Tax=Campylobacter concisus TaxID=199 RepID=A0A1X0U130_9BACT|nr:diaminopimelate epimerase [Campylobacter concisus]
MNKNKKIALISGISLVSLLLIYTLLGFFGVPYAIKNVAPKYLKDYNATLFVKEAKFNPFTFELNATNAELNTTSPLFSTKQVDVKLKPFSIFKKLIEIDIFRLDEPSVKIARTKDAIFNFNNFIGEDNASNEDNSTSSINFALNSAKIIKGSFSYSDQNLTKPFNVSFDDINYELNSLNTKKNSAGNHIFDSNSSLANKIDLKGDIRLNPLNINGSVVIKDFSIKPVAISFIDNDTLNLKNAVINLGIKYDINSDENATKINLKDSFLNIKSLNLNEGENEISLGELDLPKFDLDSKIAQKTDAAINLSAINLNDIAFKSAVSANLKALNLKDISLLANLNEKSELDAKAELKNISASILKVDEASKILATLKDLNASNLKASLLNEKITLNLEKTALSGINAPLSKDATTNVTNIQILGTSFTQDSNKSEASVNELNVNGINLKAKNKEILNVTEVIAKSIGFDILKMALNTASIDVNKPKFTSELSNNGLNAINELGLGEEKPTKTAKKPAKNEKKAESKAASKSKNSEFKFDIKNINVNNANIALTHLFEGEKIAHKFDNLFIKVANLSSDFSRPFDTKVDMKSSQKLNLNVDSKIKIEPLDVNAKIKLNDTNLPKYFAYAKPFLEADLSSGEMSANAELHYAKDIKADAKLSVKDIRLDDKNKEKLIAFKSLEVDKISLFKDNLEITGVALNSPFIKAHLSKEREFNISKILKEDKSKSQSEQKTESKKVASKKDDELNFSIKNFSLNNGEVDFSDASLFMPFATRISKLNGKLTDIDKKRPSSGEFQGVVGKNGFSKITAKLFPFEIKQNTEIKLDFKDIDLINVTPYSGQFVGYKIEKGKLNLNLKYSIIDSKLDGSNLINFDSLTLGEKVDSKDAVNLPLSLAISILSDENNQINIDLPVEGNLNDPDFKYGGVVWAAVKKLFADITLAPFRFLGNALGLGGKDLSSIDFLAGSSELISSEAPKIADFIKLTTAKPMMKLSITPTYSEIDVLHFKEKKLDQKINQIIASSGKDYITVLNSLVPNAKDKSDKALREEAIKTIEVNKEKLIELANERANAVKEALIKAGLEAGRININDATSSEPKQNTYTSVLMGVAN